LDEVTGQVISVQELLKQTLYRASANILESSARVEIKAKAEAAEDDEDGHVEIIDTDGQMKDICGGKFVVVANSLEYELWDGANGERKRDEDGIAAKHSEKRSSNAVDEHKEVEKAVKIAEEAEKVPSSGVNEGIAEINEGMLIHANASDGPAATAFANGSEVAQTSEPINGKRKAQDDEGEDRAEKKICI
jgi:hypothetical protein